MMPIHFLALALVLVATMLAACERGERPAGPEREDIPFREDGTLTFYRPGERDIVTIAIEIAEGDSAIQRGLMGRESLPPNSGMLFLMPRTEIQSFWMANTPLALDITFVAPESTVINTAKYVRPFSTRSVRSEAPARYVVETPAGFTDTHGITTGDRARWTRHRQQGANHL
jgi:uncharacterized protein